MENKELVKRKYEDACNAYLKLFCEKHGFDYDEAANSWVANDVGGTCLLGDMYASFNDIKTDIDMNAPEDEFYIYYYHSLDACDLGFNCPNYANWLSGCPRLSEEQIKSLREAKSRVYEAQKDFERILKEENDKISGGF